MFGVDECVYVEWFSRGSSEELPASIAIVEAESVSFHANTAERRVIRHPLRNTMAQFRRSLSGISEKADFVIEGCRLISDYLNSDLVTSHGIEQFALSSPEGAMWRAVAESWWDDFDTTIPDVGPRLMAGTRLVGPNSWFVAVGRRVNSRDSYTSHPSLQFLVKAASLDEVRVELLNMRDGLVRLMHHLVVASQVESD